MAAASMAPLTYFQIILSFCVYLALIYVSPTFGAPTSGLYTDKDNLLLLNKSNFAETIYNKDRAFIIEFYNTYCGHCQRYASTWVNFAGDIKNWHTIVAPAVLDCADTANVEICQDYEIPAFPTVKHFWTYLTPSDHGLPVPHRDVAYVRHNLIDFLTQNAQSKGTPNHWPMLLPISGTTLSGIWQNLPNEISSFFLVIEEASSYAGREIILDFSATDARILRVEDTSANQIDNLPHIETYPALVLLKRNENPTLLLSASSAEKAREEFRSAIEEATGISLDTSSGKDDDSGKDDGDDSAKTNQTLPVYMVDLENALHNILMQEVPLKRELTGEKLTAFQSFLAALTKTFPGRPPVMRFLLNLYNWILQQGDIVNSDDMQRTIQDLQSSDAYLPNLTEWVGCKGSTSRYRGYSCGLWTTFHSMTVQAYKNYLEGETTNPQQVLHAIHGYVYNFFGCTECANHFHSMAINLDVETQHPNDTVLWLWRAHNKVNKRLKGDRTEDPAHPKTQFPPKALCNQCRKNTDDQNIEWDLEKVLSFMMSYYGRSRISQEGVVNARSYAPRQRRELTNKFPSFGWNFRYFSGVDISLCVLLYMFSMMLLIVVFLVFRFRKHKLKRRNCFSVRQLP